MSQSSEHNSNSLLEFQRFYATSAQQIPISSSLDVYSNIIRENADAEESNVHKVDFNSALSNVAKSPMNDTRNLRSSTRLSNDSRIQKQILESDADQRLSSMHALRNYIEEGDYLWVPESAELGRLRGGMDAGSHDVAVVPAVVARIGYLYDPVTEKEKPVITVHTEDGEEREIREGCPVKLPISHHPKTISSRDIYDLSCLPLMTTNGDTGRNEVFTSEQLENIVLYTLRVRYGMDQIYTWADKVLVSINPILSLPLYTPTVMQQVMFQQQQLDLTLTSAGPMAKHLNCMGSTVPVASSPLSNAMNPAGGRDMLQSHIFTMAHNAFRFMLDTGEDQAIILLGVMGSGKSEAAKLIVQYLCEYGEHTERADFAAHKVQEGVLLNDTEGKATIQHPIGQQIMHAFTVLEAFGNAATRHNRNSSRFTKMISVEFNKYRHVIGGGFTSHHFEKSRVIETQYNGRNFHIFYQLLAGVQHDPSLRDQLELNNKCADDFVLLQRQGSYGGADAAVASEYDAGNDAVQYRDLMSSFSALQIRKNQRLEIFRIVAGLLHLGNVEFIPDPVYISEHSVANGGAYDTPSQNAPCALKDPSQVSLVARLLDVEPVVLDNYFRTRQFFSRNENNKPISSLKVVTVLQAKKARDTFIRSVYESLFHMLVETMNGFLGGVFDRYAKTNLVIQSQGIHILDTIGHEDITEELMMPLDRNSRLYEDGIASDAYNNWTRIGMRCNGFEQLCANYWSEKVHHFYLVNALSPLDAFTNSKAQDNEPNRNFQYNENKCLDTLEHSTLGLFTLLRDHCKTRSPDDEEFVSKLLAISDGSSILARPSNLDVAASASSSREYNLLFAITHYHGRIVYSGKSFTAKNNSTISATCAAIMRSSKNSILHASGAAQVTANNNAAGRSDTKESEKAQRGANNKERHRKRQQSSNNTQGIALEMRMQAETLLQALNHTGKNFLVCLKPNETLQIGALCSEYVLKQIRMMRLVDLMRASRSVFSIQMTFTHFFRRYKNICGHRGTVESLLRSLSAIGVLEEESYRIAPHVQQSPESELNLKSTKIFLTSHQWKILEQARDIYLNACATMIQRSLLGGFTRKNAAKIRETMVELREAVEKRDGSVILMCLDACKSLLLPTGNHGGVSSPIDDTTESFSIDQDIRVFSEARAVFTALEDESYVQSIAEDVMHYYRSLSDSLQIHPVLLDHALQVANEKYPSMDTVNIRKLRRRYSKLLEDELPKPERVEHHAQQQLVLNQQLWDALMWKNVEALMGTLAVLDEPTKDSRERKLATMVVIRALEEKGAIENLLNAIEQAKSMPIQSPDAISEILHIPMKIVLEKGVSCNCAALEEFLRSVIDQTLAAVPDEIGTESHRVSEADRADQDSVTLLLQAFVRAQEDKNLIAITEIVQRLLSLESHLPEDVDTSVYIAAKEQLEQENSAVNANLRRKQAVKFMSIAKTCRDLPLLTIAIEKATEAGVATWDFTMKNALKEKEVLLASQHQKNVGISESESKSENMDSLVQLLELWSVTGKSSLLAATYSSNVVSDLAQARITRFEKLEDIELCAQKLLQEIKGGHVNIEAMDELIHCAISNGYEFESYRQLIESYRAALASEKVDLEADVVEETSVFEKWIQDFNEPLAITVAFVKLRLQRHAEIRTDLLQLLLVQYERFTGDQSEEGYWHTFQEQEREKVSRLVGSIRQDVEKAFSARGRLESLVHLPAKRIDLKKFEEALQDASDAGISDCVQKFAQAKLDAAKAHKNRSVVHPNDSAGTKHSVDEESVAVCDAEEFDEDVDLSIPVTLENGASDTLHVFEEARERDEMAYYKFERLWINAPMANDSRMLKRPTLCWSPVPITQSLSVLQDEQSIEAQADTTHLAARQAEAALNINKCILGYMRDRVVLYRDMLVQYILQVGMEESIAIVDEIYLQLMRQLTQNPKRDSSLRGWSLLSVCSMTFLPSDALRNLVLKFLSAPRPNTNSFWRIVGAIAVYSHKRLQALINGGGTGFIPTLPEIQAYDLRPPFLAPSIELLDGTVLAEAFPITPDMTAEHLVEFCAHYLGLEDRLAQFLGIVSVPDKGPNQVPSCFQYANDLQKFLSSSSNFLDPSEYLGDVFERETLRGRAMKFVLKVRIVIPPKYAVNPAIASYIHGDALFDRLSYIQALDDVVGGNLLIADEDVVVRLAAYAIAIDHGGFAKCLCHSDVVEADCMAFHNAEEIMDEIHIAEYIPALWNAKRTKSEWGLKIFSALQLLLSESDMEKDNTAALQKKFIDEIQCNRLYGAVVFPCKVVLENMSSSDIIACPVVPPMQQEPRSTDELKRDASGSSESLVEMDNEAELDDKHQEDPTECPGSESKTRLSIRRQQSSRDSAVASQKRLRYGSALAVQIRTGHWLGVDLPGYYALALNIHGIHFLDRYGDLLATCNLSDLIAAYGTARRFVLTIHRVGIMKEPENLYITTKHVDGIRRFLCDFKELEGHLTATASSATTIEA